MKRILLILSLLSACLSLSAQEVVAPTSSTFGLDAKDAAAVKQMRYRMAQIRKQRPTVALVLSGGGAKGAATVGALKYMEQFDIPIDMVVGTSIGGLLGALYSMGYNADYLDSLIHNIDWSMALSDKVDSKYVPYSRTRYKEKFLLSFPFYYRTEDYKSHIAGDMPFRSARSRQLRLDAGQRGSKKASDLVQQNLLGSLPAGIVFGQNVNHIISSRTVGYSDSTDFFKFPIPFACVATDMVSGKAKIWHSGSINLAMRSTMSIPGLFAPVRTNGLVLVDGGMRNNFPVNIAREMGADIVIGIDLSGDSPDSEKIQNLGDILFSTMDLLANDAFEHNVESVDLRVHPDLKEFNMLSFNEVAVDSMFKRGYKAAQEQEQAFRALKKRLGGNAHFKLKARPAVDIGEKPVYIDDIEIIGVTEKEADHIRSKMTVKPGTVVDRDRIEKDIATIFGRGSFDYVNYEFRGTKEPYKLRILCKRGPMHQLGLSARIDTKDLVSLLVNVGLNTNALSGHSLDLTARISTNPYVDLLYSNNSPHLATFNVRAMFRYTWRNDFVTRGVLNDGTADYNLSFLLATQEVFLSNMHWSMVDAKFGIRNQFLKLNRVLFSEELQGAYDGSFESGDYPSIFVDGRIENLDNGYFPTKGTSAGVRGDLVFHMFNPNAKGIFGMISADGMLPVSFGRFTMIPQGYMRFVIGNNIPALYSNVIGGDIRGHYLEQQIPFIGLNDPCIMRNDIAVGRLDLRYRFGNSHYVSLMSNLAYDWRTFEEFQEGSFSWGVGAGYSWNTILGPLKAQLFWSSITKKVGFYLSYGYSF